MELHNKIQELRKKQNLTQEELAEKLYVSRTAISKWESGRGYPSIDSLKAISDYFDVSVDDLLSSDELLSIASSDTSNKVSHIRDLVSGLLDCSVSLFLFLPLFGEKHITGIISVPLLTFQGTSSYVRPLFLVEISLIVIKGILILSLQNIDSPLWNRIKFKVSIYLNLIAMVTFIICSQPYPALLMLVYLIIKSVIFKKMH